MAIIIATIIIKIFTLYDPEKVELTKTISSLEQGETYGFRVCSLQIIEIENIEMSRLSPGAIVQ